MTVSPPAVGDTAPDFTLNDTHGTPVTLSELRGESVMLVFVPMAFTGGCTTEFCELSENLADFDSAGVRVLGISTDTTASQRIWQEKEGITFDLLSDFWPHGQVSRAYGVFNEVSGTAVRASFLVGPDGVVRESIVNASNQLRELSWYRSAIGVV